jgi:hypothetical protein
LARGFLAGLAKTSGKRRAQAADEEAHQPGVERIGVGVVDRAQHAQGIGAGYRIRQRAHHEMEAPEELLLRHIGQGLEKSGLETGNHLGIFLGEEAADEIGRLGVGATEQAHEGLAAVPVRRHADGDAEEGLDDLPRLQRRALGLRLESRQGGDALLVEPGQAAAENGFDQRLLRAEMVVHRRQVGLGLGGDHAQRGGVEAVPDKEALGGVEDAGAGVGFHGTAGLRQTKVSNERLNADS